MTSNATDALTLTAAGVQLSLAVTPGQPPRVLHWGRALGRTSADDLGRLAFRQWVFGGPNVDIPATLSAEPGTGFQGLRGFEAHRDGADWGTLFHVVTAASEGHSARIDCCDAALGIAACYRLAMQPQTGVLTASLTITNQRSAPLQIDACTPLLLPLDERMVRLRTFHGRWAAEFTTEDGDLRRGGFLKENRAGRTGHDGFPAMIAMTPETNENNGLCAGFHLAWSGNNRLRAERLSSGKSYVQVEELLLPGEIRLSQGESYTTPDLIAAWSDEGLSDLSARFHDYLRTDVLSTRVAGRPRPVHYNTWEASYFDHSEERLRQLAERAADVGVERFVLDDGWFGARRDDTAGLGDWFVSKDVYPNGLQGLAAHVRRLGMEFGLWFEPEMVNPNSDLYRLHPDWTLGAPERQHPPFRQQLTLDLTRDEVCEYLFERMDALIADLGISYIKWDMNRDTHLPGDRHGRPAMHRQTQAVYGLMQRLRDRHRALEIESCSSGGARTDYGILRHTDRLWTSDNNDSVERQAIQRGASAFFPLEILGSHVGPRTCHITGRTIDMSSRIGTALFGHMGVEADLTQETASDTELLRRGIALYKEHRALLHSGRQRRIDGPDGFASQIVIARDGSEALVSCAKIESHLDTLPGRLRLPGLDEARIYRMRLVWPIASPTLTAPSIIDVLDLMGGGATLPGEALIHHGMELPWTFPHTVLVFHLTAEAVL